MKGQKKNFLNETIAWKKIFPTGNHPPPPNQKLNGRHLTWGGGVKYFWYINSRRHLILSFEFERWT